MTRAVNAASDEIPGMRSFDLVADAHASSTENAAIVIERQIGDSRRPLRAGIADRERDMCHAQLREEFAAHSDR